AAAKQNPEWTVAVLDCDPQRSASDWWKLADSVDDSPAFSVVTDAGDVDADLLIVDTAPGSGSGISEAVTMADLVIVPTEAETMSMFRAKKTIDAVGSKGWLLLTKARRRTRLWADTVEAIEQTGVRCFKTFVPDGVKYKGFATNPSDLGAYTDLWLEIRTIVERGN
ncbi:ParA family protein, partial [Bifidobacterium olomucense]